MILLNNIKGLIKNGLTYISHLIKIVWVIFPMSQLINGKEFLIC